MAKETKDSEQFRRFKEAVKEFEAGETDEVLDCVIRRVAPPKDKPKPKR